MNNFEGNQWVPILYFSFQDTFTAINDLTSAVKRSTQECTELKIEFQKIHGNKTTKPTTELTKMKKEVTEIIKKEVWKIDVITEGTIHLLGSPAYMEFATEKIVPQLPLHGQRNEVPDFHIAIIRLQFSDRLYHYMYPTQFK